MKVLAGVRMFLLRAGRQNLFQASRLASGGLLPSLGFLGLWMHHPHLCLHLHLLFSLCVRLYVSKFPLFIRTPVMLRKGPP